MSTNRENINKMSNKELSVLLRYQCYIGQDRKIKTIPIEGIAGAPFEDTIAKYLNKKFDSTYLSEIANWLSQEAKEDNAQQTNRDDINKMNNEELAATIMAKVSTMPWFSHMDGFTDAGKEIADWLSQEKE